MFEKKSRQKKLRLLFCTNFIKKKTEVIFHLCFCFEQKLRLSGFCKVHRPKAIKKRKSLSDFPLLILVLFQFHFLYALFHLADIGKHFQSVPQDSDL